MWVDVSWPGPTAYSHTCLLLCAKALNVSQSTIKHCTFGCEWLRIDGLGYAAVVIDELVLDDR